MRTLDGFHVIERLPLRTWIQTRVEDCTIAGPGSGLGAVVRVSVRAGIGLGS